MIMFASVSRTLASRIAPRATVNFSGARGMASHTKKDPNSFKDIYLSESGVYPIIVVLGFACSLATFVITRGLTHNPDVRITKKNRSQVIRD